MKPIVESFDLLVAIERQHPVMFWLADVALLAAGILALAGAGV